SEVHVDGGEVKFAVDLGTSGTAKREPLGEAFRKAIGALEGARTVEIQWSGELGERVPPGMTGGGREVTADDPVPGVKNVVLVMSGKGGVGKPTCATTLTLALKRAGYRVGLLDADIYGPSIPTMLGVMGRPVSTDGKTIEPLERFGVKLMSIGFLLEDP